MRASRLTRGRVVLALAAVFGAYHLYSEVRWRLGGDATLYQRLELMALDVQLAARGPRPPQEWSVAVAAADERSLERFGPLPWPRRVHAELVDELTELGAAAVAFDMTFERNRTRQLPLWRELEEIAGRLEEGDSKHQNLVTRIRTLAASQDDDGAFAAAIQRNGRVVLGVVALSREEATALGYRQTRLAKRLPRVRSALIRELLEIRAPGVEVVRSASGAFELGPYRRYFGLAAPTATLAAVGASFGALNSAPDIDGVNRSLPYLVAFDSHDALLPTLAVAAVAVAKEQPVEVLGRPGDPVARGLRIGGTRTSLGVEARGRIDWYGGYYASGLPRLSIAQIIEGKISRAQVEGRIIFVAATAVGTYDQRVTPLERAVPGVYIHASLAQNLLDGRRLQRTWVVVCIELLLIVFIGIAFGVGNGRWSLRGVVASVLILGWGSLDHFVMLERGLIAHTIIPATQLVLTVLLVSIWGFADEARERRRTRTAFGRYLSPKVMDQVLSDPDRHLRLGGQRQPATVLFSDIRGFTSISERLNPEELGILLNLYMTPMTRVVFDYDGTLDKYMGDALMAFWGAPVRQDDHPVLACRAALAMLDELKNVNSSFELRGLPTLAIGVGISTGDMTIGNMGSDDFFAYTALGDRVNLGSRLEGQTKNYGVDILISEATYTAVREEMLCRELDLVRVKGKRAPERIYELIGPHSEHTDRVLFVQIFEEALDAFRDRRFEEAHLLFAEASASRESDRCAAEYSELSAHLSLHPPPPDWDGVRDATTK